MGLNGDAASAAPGLAEGTESPQACYTKDALVARLVPSLLEGGAEPADSGRPRRRRVVPTRRHPDDALPASFIHPNVVPGSVVGPCEVWRQYLPTHDAHNNTGGAPPPSPPGLSREGSQGPGGGGGLAREGGVGRVPVLVLLYFFSCATARWGDQGRHEQQQQQLGSAAQFAGGQDGG